MASETERIRRILIVDDNQAIHEDFRKVLDGSWARPAALNALERALYDEPASRDLGTSEPFELDSAYQGQEALALVTAAAAAGQPYALAFVDMRMPPGWDGLETIERLWAVDPYLQVVICSAYSDHSWADFRARLGERDALLILRKPFDSVEVVQCSHALTTKWRLACQARAHVEQLETAVRTRTAELEAVNRRLADEMLERERVAAELRVAQRLEAVGQLAAGVAHEINTPVQYVGDSLHFVRDAVLELLRMAGEMREIARVKATAPTSELIAALETVADAADLPYFEAELPPALDRIGEGIGRVSAIVRAMKELAHPGPSECNPTDLNRALENALQVTANAYRYVATVETDLGDLPLVRCHPGELNQVFLNLIVNAGHAMEEGGSRGAAAGRLRVHSRVDGADVVISIADTGSGIPEAVRQRIFDAFFTTKEVGRGTGQGLPISRSIVVDRHGGQLTFDSTVGVGTTFHVRLPIAGPTAAAGERPRELHDGSLAARAR